MYTFGMLVECDGTFAFNTRHDLALCAQLHVDEGGGQGPCGGCALVYMYKYTDQEISLLTTLHIYWFTCR